MFWITFPGQSLQDFEVTLVFKLVAPEIHSNRIIVGLLSFTSAPSIHQAYVSGPIQYSGYNTFLQLPKYCCLFLTNCFGFYFFLFFFCTNTMRKNHSNYSIAFRKTAWKYLNITNQNFFIIRLLKPIKSKVMNYCQRQGFQALIAATSRIKTLILVNFSELSGAEQRQVSNLYCREP